MIKSLKEARITDGLPRIVAQQLWVQAFSGALGEIHQKTLEYIDNSQIYTAIDSATENVLDTLAVNWNIDWYDTGYSIEQKRRVVKTALTIRRTLGTVGAVKEQINAIYPGAILEEWFEWGGEPGYFRIQINGAEAMNDDLEPLYRAIESSKRFSAQLEKVSVTTDYSQTIGVGLAHQIKLTKTYVMEEFDVNDMLDWLVDESGNILIDELGNILVE